MTERAADSEQALVFGEVAEQYDRARPSYPDALFDTVARATAGSGRATPRSRSGREPARRRVGSSARGVAVHALEPSPGMAAVLRGHGVDVEATTFEAFDPGERRFRLVYAAQAWHWVQRESRYEKVAVAARTGRHRRAVLESRP